ncbi:glycosyltransferase N-terminal domain-containing protein [Alisedimentitalea sp. MJ-SS2]|nr:glycosyltransferase N-terminal domain-containing protein [Alisedimentitalea sp. MJ-SS2]
MPGLLFYLWNRGRHDPLYRQRLGQRFGFHAKRDKPHVWIHAVSIGELRSVVPLIRALLERGEHVVTTHFTPAGLREAEKIFTDEIVTGQLSAVYVPFDYGLAFRRFFRAFRPKYGLVMEVEFWPGMITASRRTDIPLFLCNGQYPAKSFERDKDKSLSPALLVPGFAGVMVKSDLQASRFQSLGQNRIAITGEMRFEQPVPPAHLARAADLRAMPALADRPIITLASVVEWEEDLFLSATQALLDRPQSTRPLIVYVPRAPERFDAVADKLADAGLSFACRSTALNPDLSPVGDIQDLDILLGDSLGEMFFYLALCDFAVTGGGFNPRGSHNIIEPLALGKPVIVGPEIWTIEYPAVEAIAAGVAQQVDGGELPQTLLNPQMPDQAQIDTFLADHAGAVKKTLIALETWFSPET